MCQTAEVIWHIIWCKLLCFSLLLETICFFFMFKGEWRNSETGVFLSFPITYLTNDIPCISVGQPLLLFLLNGGGGGVNGIF